MAKAVAPQASLSVRTAPPMQWMSSAYRSSVEHSVITAPSAGGRSAATWSPLNPPQLMPIIPTRPAHQGCAATHAMTASASSCSCRRYSPRHTPSLSPVPRMSTRRQA